MTMILDKIKSWIESAYILISMPILALLLGIAIVITSENPFEDQK